MGVGVDLYLWSLTEAADPAILSHDEVARMNRFVYQNHQRAFLAARAGLRLTLGEIVGAAPASLTFDYGPQGKPTLADGPSFNLSHSDEVACLAVHTDLDIGVDVEAFRKIEPDLPARFFSEAENAALNALPPQEWEAGFFRCWTRKEALIKALGGGLSIPLDAFDVTLDAKHATITRLDADYGTATEWALAPFQIGQQMMGCVAAKTDGAALDINVKSASEAFDFQP